MIKYQFEDQVSWLYNSGQRRLAEAPTAVPHGSDDQMLATLKNGICGINRSRVMKI